MTKTITKKPNPRSQKAFLVYYELGVERSLDRVHQELSKGDPKSRLSLTSLKKFSREFNWVDKVGQMDDRAMARAEEEAIKKATVKKSTILEIAKDAVELYAEKLKVARASDDMSKVDFSASDFKKIWEILRMETGQKTADDGMEKLADVIDARTLIIIKNAENLLWEGIKEDIRNEPDEPNT